MKLIIKDKFKVKCKIELNKEINQIEHLYLKEI